MAEQEKVILGDWTCQKCQAVNEPAFTHCRVCGEKNPQAPECKKCAKCGAVTDFFAKECHTCHSPEFLQL